MGVSKAVITVVAGLTSALALAACGEKPDCASNGNGGVLIAYQGGPARNFPAGSSTWQINRDSCVARSGGGDITIANLLTKEDFTRKHGPAPRM